jgi:hypothetical protein
MTFGKDEEWVPLQVADLIAGLCKEFSVEKVKGAPNLEAKAKTLQEQMGGAMGLSYLDETILRKIVEANHLHDGRPSIRSAKQAKLFSDLLDIPRRAALSR